MTHIPPGSPIETARDAFMAAGWFATFFALVTVAMVIWAAVAFKAGPLLLAFGAAMITAVSLIYMRRAYAALQYFTRS